MSDPHRPDPHRKDHAFLADGPHAVTHDEQMFSGALSFCRRRYARDLAGVDVAVVGVPYDQAVSGRPGARFGPRAIREASANLAWCRAWPSPFDPFEKMAVVDWGDVHIQHYDNASTPFAIQSAMATILAAGAAPLMLGGDHYCTLPVIRAHAEKLGRPLALVQFDSHADTGDTGPTDIDHGTMVTQGVAEGCIDAARSIQVGIRTTYEDHRGIAVYDAIQVHETGVAATAQAIRDRVGDAPVYLTFDIDGLDPAFAPGTGTPVVGGLATWQALAILRALDGIDLKGMDVVEVAPAYDVGQITALAGATLALQMLCLHARRPGGPAA